VLGTAEPVNGAVEAPRRPPCVSEGGPRVSQKRSGFHVRFGRFAECHIITVKWLSRHSHDGFWPYRAFPMLAITETSFYCSPMESMPPPVRLPSCGRRETLSIRSNVQ
jgi:hypothetical protein